MDQMDQTEISTIIRYFCQSVRKRKESKFYFEQFRDEKILTKLIDVKYEIIKREQKKTSKEWFRADEIREIIYERKIKNERTDSNNKGIP